LNYLAHFHLSHGDDQLLLGALLGDFVKGPLKGERSKGLEQGIFLHRKIDAFTDSNEALKQVHQLFSSGYRRYAGIMTDVVFDHFLTLHWSDFHHQPLKDFSQQIYLLLDNSDQLSGTAKLQAENLSRYDVFQNYQYWETVEATLEKISQRLSRTNPLATAAKEMTPHYNALEKAFLVFYPQLQGYAEQVRKSF
jgi:acyl carrier protein phosphodiesterase